jgi:hypothetical protein
MISGAVAATECGQRKKVALRNLKGVLAHAIVFAREIFLHDISDRSHPFLVGAVLLDE